MVSNLVQKTGKLQEMLLRSKEEKEIQQKKNHRVTPLYLGEEDCLYNN